MHYRKVEGPRRAFVAAAASLFVLVASPAKAQPKSQDSFEVASVKPGTTAELATFTLTGGRFLAENTPLKEFIKFAYNISDWQLSGGPGWVGSDRYTIEAKKPNLGLNIRRDDQLRLMLRSLLAERFSLVLNKQTKTGTLYALVVDKAGLKISPLPFPTDSSAYSGAQFRRSIFVADHSSMADVAFVLSQKLQYPVRDETAATGAYSFQVDFSNGGTTDVQSLFSLLPSQIGLRLEKRTGPVDFYIVDQVQRPSPN